MDSAWKTIAGTYIVEICEDAETIKISMPLRIKDTTKYAVNNVLNNKINDKIVKENISLYAFSDFIS